MTVKLMNERIELKKPWKMMNDRFLGVVPLRYPAPLKSPNELYYIQYIIPTYTVCMCLLDYTFFILHPIVYIYFFLILYI